MLQVRNPGDILISFLDEFLSFFCELIRRRRLRSEYLKIGEYIKKTPDCWQDWENNLLDEIEKKAGEGWW